MLLKNIENNLNRTLPAYDSIIVHRFGNDFFVCFSLLYYVDKKFYYLIRKFDIRFTIRNTKIN